MSLPATLRENSTWTPKSYGPSNQKIFNERMNLIKKWYSAWDQAQRWTLLEYLLRQQDDSQLSLIHNLLHPAMPPPNHDFTRVLPRYLTLKIFSLLDPQSLCRAAQVCWFWKFLAESNGIWQKKCLKLGWFLPTPPYSHDYTVWKRHYISCVCQLHWNPPQAPEEEEDSFDEVDTSALLEEERKKKKKRRSVHRHTLSNDDKRPWRDPDRHPHETHFSYNSLYCSFIGTRQGLEQPQPLPSAFMAPPLTTTSMDGTNLLPPPDSLIHPILLEKMRLGSPSSSHIQLSTLNTSQSQQDISEAFYDLHKTTPFPRLPPYYVHKSGDSQGTSQEDKNLGVSSSRPPSGRSKKRPGSGKVTVLEETKGRRQSEVNRTSPRVVHKDGSNSQSRDLRQDGLRSRPWSIPTEPESDDDI